MAVIDIASARTFVLDLGERALSTAWQAGVGAAIPIVLSSTNGDLLHLAWWKMLLMAVLGAAVSAVLSMVKSVLAGFRTGTASTSKTVAQSAASPGAHATDKTEQAVLAEQSAALASALPVPVTPESLLAGLPTITDAHVDSILSPVPTSAAGADTDPPAGVDDPATTAS